MGEIIKDYTINEIKQGIEKDMALEMSKKKYLRGHDLQQQAYNRRIKVQNNIVNIYNNLVNHRKISKDTEKKFQQLQIKYANLRDRELPLIARVEFSYVTSLQTKKAAIEKFATKLDTYEDEVLKLLRPLVQLKNEENKFFEGNVDKEDSNLDNVCGPHLKFYIKGQDIKDKSLVLNESTNPVPIHKILQESSINKGDVRKIDYSGCTNKSIKDKMINCLGGKEYCYISYSDKTKTYNLFDKEGKLLSQRAYIREGVKLFPPYLLKWEGRQKAKEKAEKAAINKMKNLSPNKEKELLGRIPEKLKNKLTEAQQKEFIKYTENILNSTVLSARKNGEQLSGEPIKMTNFEGIKLCTTTTQNRYWRDIHPNKYYNISEDLNKILNENERHVLTYLNIRVHEKWNDASNFANRDIVNVKPKEENDRIVTSEEIQNFENGINELLGLLSNYKMRVVPDFFAWNAYDKPVADLETYLNNLISTLYSGIFNKSLIKQAEKDISHKLKECGFVHDGPKNSGRTIEDFVKIMLESEDKERQLALRNLGETSNRMGHDTSLSSDQLRSTAINMDNIKIKEEEYNESLQKIKIYFSIGENDSVDGNNKCQAAKNIDILYSCTSSKHLFEFFRKNKLVPAQCDYSDFKDVCENIFKKIESDNKLIEEKESELRNNCKGRLDDKYNEVLAKEYKDEEDISFLNKYELLSSPDGKQALDEMIDKIILSVANSIKYLNTVSFLNGTLGLQLARLGGGLDKTGLSGIDLNIVEEFNDSIGEGGRFNKSDEGLELTINIATEVIKEVIICLIVMVLTDGVGVPARIASKLPKWGLKITNRILKGVAFHAASTLIHNTIDVINGDKVLSEMGEGLDDRKGYATSVIFFAVMELVPIGVGKIHTKFSKNKVLETLKNLERAGKLPEGKTAEMIAKDLEGNIKGTMALVTSDMGPLCKGLANLGVSTELFVTELTSMLLAEQIGSLLTEGGFHNPTPEGIAQTIGMILAFKGIGRIKKIIKGNKGEKIFQIEKSNSKTIEISENELNGILDEFDSKIMSKEGITFDGHTYRLEYRNNTSKNSNKKGEFVRTVDGKTICTAKSENSKVLPDNSKGNSIRKLFDSVREKYLSNKLGVSNTRIKEGLEKDLGTSETEIVAIEKEINELTTERDKLSEDNKGDNKKEQERKRKEVQKEQTDGKRENTEIKPEENVNERVEISDRNVNWYTEQLNKYKVGEVFELTYNTQQGQVREIYVKDKDGYSRAKEKDGKYVKTEERLTEQQMIEKMRSRNTLISEIITSGNIEQESYGKIKIGNKEFNIQEENGKKFVEINGEKYYEYKNDISGLGYEICAEYSYIGNYKNGKVEGRGTVYTNKYKYEGEFKNSLENGKGTKTFTSGDKYEGEFKNGLENGKGKYTWADGSRYEGEFKNDMFDGKGKEYKDGKIYELEFTDGYMKNGIEISNIKGNKIVKFVGDVNSEFIKNQLNTLGKELKPGEKMEIEVPNRGKIKIKNIEGNLVEINGIFSKSPIKGELGDYVENKINKPDARGKNNEKHQSEKVKNSKSGEQLNQIEYTNNNENILENLKGIKLEDYIIIDSNGKIGIKPEHIIHNRGELKSYLEIQGNKYQIFSNGKGDGVGITLGSREFASINGKLIEGMYSWGEYDIQIGNFKNGKLEGEGIRISRGKKEEGKFKNGELDGKGKIYENNQLAYEGEFKNGVYNGKGKEYDANGTIVYEGEFKNGSRLNKAPEVSNKRVNTERKEMSDVYRETDVVAIGDLHGEYAALKGNMEFAGLAKEVNGHLEWTGGNKKVVFQGDILADRGTDGLRIIEEIHQLREQARKQGGDIDIIVGNHDDFLISFLTQRGGVHLNGIEVANHPQAPTQGLGLTELANFIGGKAGNFNIIRGQQNNILKAMRNSPKGRLILEEICNMKLVSQVDDVLYIHTNPTDAILNFLTSRGEGNVQKMINAINSKYQNYLRTILLGGGNITSQQMKEFNGLSDLFLNTDNRITSQNLYYYQKLKNSGINMISHGHSGGSAIPENTVDIGDWKRHYLYEGNQANIGGVKIVDTDYSYGKRGRTGGQHSVSIIKKEGGVNYIGDNVAYANREYQIGTEVYVKRNNGGESKAKVISYDPETGEYTVIWEEEGKTCKKTTKPENLRKIEEEIFELDPDDLELFSDLMNIANKEGIIFRKGENPERSKNMQINFEGEVYENGQPKKGIKTLENGLIIESGEYDINGNMIRGEKYQYSSQIYDSEGLPVNGRKITSYIGKNGNLKIIGETNRMGDYIHTDRLTYYIDNQYGVIELEGIGNNTFIHHARMSNPALAGKAFLELANVIPEGCKLTETESLSGDSFPLFLREYQKDFRTDYTVRATGEYVNLNSQGLNTPESQLIKSKNVGKDSSVFEAATQADAQEVANAINNLIKDRGQPLKEGQGIVELAEARVVQCKENGLRRVEVPQIEMVKEFNNGVELAQQLNKCTTYNEMENILLTNLTTEYHFRDGNLTGEELLQIFRAYRETYINGGEGIPRNVDPRIFFPSEFIVPSKRQTTNGTVTRRNVNGKTKTNIHKLLDYKG